MGGRVPRSFSIIITPPAWIVTFCEEWGRVVLTRMMEEYGRGDGKGTGGE